MIRGFLFLLAAAAVPAVASAAAGEVWVPAGPNGAIVQAVAVDSNGIVYAGVRNGGVFKSSDGGASFDTVSVGLTSLDVVSLAVSPGNPQIVLAGTELGLFRSTNAGGSWTAISGPPADQIGALAFDPTAPTNAYGVSISGWVGRSTNAGETWQALGGDVSAQRPQSVTVDPTQGTTVYVGTLDNGIYKSTNSGGTFAPMNTGLGNLHVAAIGVDPTSSATVYAGTDTGGVFRSQDGGTTWTAFTTGISGSDVDGLVVDPEGRAYVTNGNGIFASIPSGIGWTQLSGLRYGNAIALGPGTPGRLFVGYGQLPFSDGGLVSTDDRVHFLPAAEGLNGVTVTALARDPSNPQRVLTCGPFFGDESLDGGVTWGSLFAPPLCASIAFDPADANIVYVGASTTVFKSTDGGVNFANTAGLPTSPVRAVLVLHAAGLVLAGTGEGVYRSSDAGATWSAPGTATPAVVYSLAEDPGAATTVWAGAEDGIYRSTDSGVNWTLAFATTDPVLTIFGSAVANRIFAGSRGKVFVSNPDRSAWTQVQGGLPSTDWFDFAEDPGRGAVYAGGLAGVYESLDDGATWASAGPGLTNNQVQALLVLPNGTLLAGTRGGSVFRRIQSSAEREPVVRAEDRGEPREVPPRP